MRYALVVLIVLLLALGPIVGGMMWEPEKGPMALLSLDGGQWWLAYDINRAMEMESVLHGIDSLYLVLGEMGGVDTLVVVFAGAGDTTDHGYRPYKARVYLPSTVPNQ